MVNDKTMMMKRILEITENDNGLMEFKSEFTTPEAMDLLSKAFYSMLTEQDDCLMNKVFQAIDFLILADISASREPQFMLDMYCDNCRHLSASAQTIISKFSNGKREEVSIK